MSKKILELLFDSAEDCKEHSCTINKNSILFAFKPDNGLKDLDLQEDIFGHRNQIPLCDCIIKTNNDLVLLEIKCGVITKRILNEIKIQIENVAKILKNKGLLFESAIFIGKRLDTVQLRKEIGKIRIFNKSLQYKEYTNQAISL
jgi:hypothetical protein